MCIVARGEEEEETRSRTFEDRQQWGDTDAAADQHQRARLGEIQGRLAVRAVNPEG